MSPCTGRLALHQRLALCLLALAACCAAPAVVSAQAGGTCSEEACPPVPPNAPMPSPAFAKCLEDAAAVAKAPGAIIWPDEPRYSDGRVTFNVRKLSSPAAVFFAQTTADVAAATKCAAAEGLQISPAAGRQGFQGGSMLDGALVIDVTNLTETSVSADKKSFTAGAGLSNVMLLAALHDANVSADAAIPHGVCSFVGIPGWNLGGGFGRLGRYLGLGCDNVEALEMVLANGTVVEATATNNSDLLWASCGGGGGTLGTVTKLQFKISELPKGGMTLVKVNWTPGVDNATAAMQRFLGALPTLDKRFGFTSDLAKAGYSITGLFLGPPEEALSLLEAAGLLEDLDAGSIYGESVARDKYPAGLLLQPWASYWEYYTSEELPTWASYAPGSPWGADPGAFTPTEANIAYLNKVARGQDGTHVTGKDLNAWYNSQSRILGADFPEEGIRALVQWSQDKWDECVGDFKTVPCALAITGHVLGGAYSEPEPDAAAFPHRDGLLLVDAVITIPTGLALSPQADRSSLQTAFDIPEEFIKVVQPYIKGAGACYVNYLPDTQPADWERCYWGGNVERLQAIKDAYDPQGVFTKSSTIGAGSPNKVTASDGAPAPAPAAPAPAAPAPLEAPKPTSASCQPAVEAVALLVAALAAGAVLL